MKDLDFAVNDASGKERLFKTFGEACVFAVSLSTSTGIPVNVDVLCWSRKAAAAFGVAEAYDEDPDASVTERIVIRAESIGRVA